MAAAGSSGGSGGSEGEDVFRVIVRTRFSQKITMFRQSVAKIPGGKHWGFIGHGFYNYFELVRAAGQVLENANVDVVLEGPTGFQTLLLQTTIRWLHERHRGMDEQAFRNLLDTLIENAYLGQQ